MITYLQIMEELTSEESVAQLPQRLEIPCDDRTDCLDKYTNNYKSLFANKNFTSQILYHTPRSEGVDTIELIEKVRIEIL